jgi:hypothetical protein
MNIAEKIYQHAQDLPEAYALEALHFLEFLRFKSETFINQDLNQNPSESFIVPQKNRPNLRELLKNYPVGNRLSSDVDQQINALRNEWD